MAHWNNDQGNLPTIPELPRTLISNSPLNGRRAGLVRNNHDQAQACPGPLRDPEQQLEEMRSLLETNIHTLGHLIAIVHQYLKSPTQDEVELNPFLDGHQWRLMDLSDYNGVCWVFAAVSVIFMAKIVQILDGICHGVSEWSLRRFYLKAKSVGLKQIFTPAQVHTNHIRSLRELEFEFRLKMEQLKQAVAALSTTAPSNQFSGFELYFLMSRIHANHWIRLMRALNITDLEMRACTTTYSDELEQQYQMLQIWLRRPQDGMRTHREELVAALEVIRYEELANMFRSRCTRSAPLLS